MHKKEHFSICDFSGAGRQAVPMGQMAVVQLSDRDPHTRPGRLHPCPTVWGSLSKGSDALPGWYLKFSDSSVFWLLDDNT